MTYFTAEEFDTMIAELLYEEPVSYDMLCQIAEKTLKSSIRRWCAADYDLRGKGYEDDIFQDTVIRLVKTCISGFLLRGGVNGALNRDMEGFKNWMFRIALNVKRDYANEVRGIAFRTQVLEEGEEDDIPDPTNPTSIYDDDSVDRLSQAFAIVLDSDIQVYKVLTWLAQSMLIIGCDVSKIQSNDMILQSFENRTLRDMRNILFASAKHIPWMRITPQQRRRIDTALKKPYDEQSVYGDIMYKEFFMQKGGKATISDWANRMNNMIRRVMTDAACNG